MVKKIAFSLALITVLVGVALWSYERGLSVNSTLEATRVMVNVQIQRDCVEKSDQSCMAEANRILAVLIAGQLRRSDLSVLSKSDREAVEAFINETESTR